MATIGIAALPTFLAATETAEDINHDYGSLIFIGVFFLALIGVAIWWLKR